MTHEERCRAWKWLQENLPDAPPWPLDYINDLQDMIDGSLMAENGRLRAELDEARARQRTVDQVNAGLYELAKDARKILQYVADAEPSDFYDGSWAWQWIAELQIDKVDPLLKRYEITEASNAPAPE